MVAAEIFAAFALSRFGGVVRGGEEPHEILQRVRELANVCKPPQTDVAATPSSFHDKFRRHHHKKKRN